MYIIITVKKAFFSQIKLPSIPAKHLLILLVEDLPQIENIQNLIITLSHLQTFLVSFHLIYG